MAEDKLVQYVQAGLSCSRLQHFHAADGDSPGKQAVQPVPAQTEIAPDDHDDVVVQPLC